MKRKVVQKKKWGGLVLVSILVVVTAVFCYFIPKAIAPESNVALPDQNESAPTADQIETPAKVTETIFAFAGDMMFDRYVNHQFKNIGLDHIFDHLDKTLFSNSDISFANLEGPVSTTPIDDDYPARTLIFSMPPTTISTIKNLGLNGVSLANNHTLNAGASGFATTQKILNSAGIKYAGSQNGFDAGNIVEYDTVIPVSIICVDYLAYANNDKIAAAIRAEKSTGKFVIIFPHWGTEYSLSHSAKQEIAAKKWIDAGADLIIGSHPHVVEDIDVYKNKPIIYSLGNFVFDQTFSADTQQGLIVSGKITAEKLELTLYPIQSIRLYPQLATEEVKNAMILRILNSQNLEPLVQNGDTILIGR